ncbi:MAG: ribonuclease Z [Desulfatibacillaceae bacterium]
MHPSFHPRLVGADPFGDPCLYIPFTHDKRAILFDLGNTPGLSGRDMLKATHVFVTHTHMDHFIGFDHLVRTLLGRDKTLDLFGPPGFFANVEGKLAGYTWNLVENYENPFVLRVHEVGEQAVSTREYHCREGFAGREGGQSRRFDGVLLEEPGLAVRAAVLDHRIPCLAFALKERFHVNVMKERLDAAGLATGPWLKEAKNLLYEKAAPDTPVRALQKDGQIREMPLGEARKKLMRITPGQKVAYVTDVAGHKANADKIVDLVRDADKLFIEASFLHADADAAREKHHLTARQAGTLARLANVGQLTVFHFSARYTRDWHLLEAEARLAFEGEQDADFREAETH